MSRWQPGGVAREWLRRLLLLIERRIYARIPECTVLRVIHARQITPHMRRVTFSGKQLSAFATDEHLHVRLLLPPTGARRDGWLPERANGRAALRDNQIESIWRKYTVRRVDAAAGQLDIDFVLHADGGPGASWAEQARAGDTLGILGPGGRGIERADWYLLAGDESALPAIARMLEQLPDTAQGQILLEVAGPQEEQLLTVPPDMTLRWLHRHGIAPGRDTRLQEEVERIAIPDDGRALFVWAAAEIAATRAIGRHLRNVAKLKKEQMRVVPYWRLSGDPRHG